MKKYAVLLFILFAQSVFAQTGAPVGPGYTPIPFGISSGGGPEPPPAHVQSGFVDGSGTTCAVTLPTTVKNGDTAIGYVFYPSAQTISSILDDKGNSYLPLVKNVPSGGTFSLSSFALVNIANGPKTITVTFSASTSVCGAGVDEYANVSGLDTTTPSGGATGQFISTATGTNALTSGSLTTTTNGDLIWGAITGNAAQPSSGTGFTLRINDSANGFITEDLIQSIGGSTAATSTVSSGGGWAIAVALRPLATQSLVSFVGNSGASNPIYSGNVDPHGIYVPSTNTTWLAYEGWNGVYRTEQVTTFNHSTQTWSAIYNGITSGSVNNDHPNPAICRDAGGYVHMFSGHHPFSLDHSVTTNPDDPSSWVIQTSPTGSGSTSPAAYPHCYLIGSTLYLFVQGSTWAQLQLYISSSVVSGIVTWNAPITIADFGGGSGSLGNRFYQSNAVVVGSNINFVFCYSDNADTFSRGLYFMSYNTVTGSVTNLQGTTTTAAASFPVLKTTGTTTLDGNYLVADNTNNNTLINSTVLGYDTNGNADLIMWDAPAGTTYNMSAYRWNGSTLSGPTLIDSSPSQMSATFVPKAGGSMDLYYAKQGALPGFDGNIWKVTLSAGGSWGTPSLLQQQASFPLGEPVAIASPNAAARVYWSEANQNADAPIGTLKFFLYGDGGFVQRQTASLSSPQPLVSSVPASAWNPSDMTSDMNLVGNNLLANPGPASTTYPSTVASGDPQVRSTTSHASGKFHVEFLAQQSQTPLSAYDGFGVCSGSHLQNRAVGLDTLSAALYGDAFYQNTGTQTVLGGDLTDWPQGYWFAFEVDLTAKLAWFKNITHGGNWNNSGTANPATGTGGISLSTLTGSPWFLCVQISQYQDGIALNTGEFSFLLTPSSGFGAW